MAREVVLQEKLQNQTQLSWQLIARKNFRETSCDAIGTTQALVRRRAVAGATTDDILDM